MSQGNGRAEEARLPCSLPQPGATEEGREQDQKTTALTDPDNVCMRVVDEDDD